MLIDYYVRSVRYEGRRLKVISAHGDVGVRVVKKEVDMELVGRVLEMESSNVGLMLLFVGCLVVVLVNNVLRFVGGY